MSYSKKSLAYLNDNIYLCVIKNERNEKANYFYNLKNFN